MSNTRSYIYQIIQVIPYGKVIYYGQISDVLLASHDIFLRGQVVGWQMSSMKKSLEYQESNWQRVIAKTGQIVTHKLGLIGNLQLDLLAAEGVTATDGRIDMAKYGIATEELLNIYQEMLK